MVPCPTATSLVFADLPRCLVAANCCVRFRSVRLRHDHTRLLKWSGNGIVTYLKYCQKLTLGPYTIVSIIIYKAIFIISSIIHVSLVCNFRSYLIIIERQRVMALKHEQMQVLYA